ncbi:MAG: hypothetical protein HS104_11040 [Polyangiaceae bacterium]|nr:hypothetical protein [Polyangiaceae bacterium]MCL4748678.1 hypothetical protein [Myxococcales bacterium]
MPHPLRRVLRLGLPLAGALGLALACSRSGLDADDFEWIDGRETPPDAGLGGAAGAAGLPDAQQPNVCVPSEEVCNGTDDDCDGQTDELSPVPCPGGGEQYCVSGAWSACPEKCEACMPGSERVCFNSYCKYWGVQTCTADGKSFGKCKEHDPPPECKSIAKDKKYSPELEQCCLDNGYCCRDTFDLDDDGDSGEMLGDCEDVLCKP